MGGSQKSPVRPILADIIALGLTLCMAGCADSNGVYRDGTLAKGHSGIKGRVTDSHGAPVAGATVQVQGKESNETKQCTTDTNGEFMAYVRPGNYTLTFKKDGFQPSTANETAQSKVYLTENLRLVTVVEAQEEQEEKRKKQQDNEARSVLLSLLPLDVIGRCGQPDVSENKTFLSFTYFSTGDRHPDLHFENFNISGKNLMSISLDFAHPDYDLGGYTLDLYYAHTLVFRGSGEHELRPSDIASIMPCLMKGGAAR